MFKSIRKFIAKIVFACIVVALAVILFVNKTALINFYHSFNTSRDIATFVGSYQKTVYDSNLKELETISKEDEVLYGEMKTAVSDDQKYKSIARDRLVKYQKALEISKNALVLIEGLPATTENAKNIKQLFKQSIEMRKEGYELFIEGLNRIGNNEPFGSQFDMANNKFSEAKKIDTEAYDKIKELCTQCTISVE